MTETLWLKQDDETGQLALIVDEQGRLILCDECPCQAGMTCEQTVDAKAAEMLALVDETTHQPIWSLLGTHTSDYMCAVWSYDDQTDQWTLASQASGHLLVALARGSTVQDTAEGGHELLTYAKTLLNTQTQERTTIGCRCRVSGYECKPKAVVLAGYDMAGQLGVWTPGQGETYQASDACRVDTCALLNLKLTTAQLWHGGTLIGEGYYDWLLTPGSWEPANYRYQPFLRAVRWTGAGSADNITYLNCDCTGILTHTLAASESCMEYAGICTLQDPCIAMMLLHNRAVYNGWTWHGEGVLVHKARCMVNGSAVAYGSWYAIREQTWTGQGLNSYSESVAYSVAMCCAETSDGYWVMGCGCGSPVFYNRDTPVQGYYAYLELDGVCDCDTGNRHYPDMELLLAYPAEFGVSDVVWGNDNKFQYTYSSGEGCNVCGNVYDPYTGSGQATMYIDYRAMCFTGSAFDRSGVQCTWLRVVYPYGSRGAPWQYNLPQYFTWPDNVGANCIFTSVSFTGSQFMPFTEDMDIYQEVNGVRIMTGLKFTGEHYTWGHEDNGGSEGAQVNGCQPTETETSYADPYYDDFVREELAGCDDPAPTPCIYIDDRSPNLWNLAALLSPDLTVTLQQQCNVRRVAYPYIDPETGDVMDIDYRCFYTRKWYTVGANLGGCAWYLLNIGYVCTNKGFIIKGLNGFHETYVLPGAVNAPGAAACWPSDWKEPEYDPGSGTWYDPHHWLDQTITCTADEDMHFCIEGFELLVDEDEGESE